MPPKNTDLKQLLHDKKTDTTGSGKSWLLLRIGQRHCGFAIVDSDELIEIGFCSIEQFNQNEWNAFWDAFPALNDKFAKVLVSWDFIHGIITNTQSVKNDSASELLRIAGEPCSDNDIDHDLIAEQQLEIIYALLPEFKKWLRNKKTEVQFLHQYTTAIRSSLSDDEAGNLLVDFRENDFTVSVTKKRHAFLAQTFSYAAPDDVLFYLLKICNQFDLSQETVMLQLSGLIEQNSAMYRELYQYFINVSFRQPSWKSTGAFPAHFFTSFNDLARCVS